MLTEEEKGLVVQGLIGLVNASGNAKAILVAPFIVAAGNHPFAARLNGNAPPYVIVNEAVSLCISDRWDNNPIWMALLLSSIELIAGIPPIIDRIKRGPSPGGDPADALLLD